MKVSLTQNESFYAQNYLFSICDFFNCLHYINLYNTHLLENLFEGQCFSEKYNDENMIYILPPLSRH